jgi:predicted MFS family arabinose efflux permease
MLAIALVLFTLDRYDSPVLAGIVAFASTFPGLLISPIAGALLDRHGRTRLVVADYLLAGAACWVIGGLALAGLLTPELLVALAVFTGLTTPLSTAGLRGLLPLIVPKHLWERANAIDSNGYVIAALVGPPAGGALVALFQGPVAIALIGFVFVVGAVAILRIPEPRIETASSGSLLRDAWEGLAYVARHPTLRTLGLSISALNASYGVLQIVVPVLLLRLGQGPAVVGLTWAALGVAGVASTLVFGRMDSRGREKALLTWPMLGIAGAVALMLIPAGLPVVLLALALFGFLNGPLDIGLFTIRQRRTDAAWMGRAFAISMSINAVGVPIGSAVAGVLVTSSVEAAIGVAVASCLAGAAICWAFMPGEAETVAVPRPAT